MMERGEASARQRGGRAIATRKTRERGDMQNRQEGRRGVCEGNERAEREKNDACFERG